MPEEQFIINQATFEEAHESSNREWLKTTFDEVRPILEDGE